MATLDLQISAGADDTSLSHGSGGSFQPSTNEMWAGDGTSTIYDFASTLRYPNVAIPQGATITAAYLEVWKQAGPNGSIPATRIRGEDADDAAQIASTADFDGRTRTTASVSWTPANWTTGEWVQTPDLTAVIQEIVDRAGWESGNALQLFWEDGADGWGGTLRYIGIASYEADTDHAAKLHIEFASAVSLVIQDVSHGHAAEAPALTEHALLAVQAVDHGHPVDAVALAEHAVIATQGVRHSHTPEVLASSVVFSDGFEAGNHHLWQDPDPLNAPQGEVPIDFTSTERPRTGTYSYKLFGIESDDPLVAEHSLTATDRISIKLIHWGPWAAGGEHIFSCWYYWPSSYQVHDAADPYTNIMQWKGRGSPSFEPTWVVAVSGHNGVEDRLVLHDIGGLMTGTETHAPATPVIVPKDRWFNITAHYIPHLTAGKIDVYIDGELLLDLGPVQTITDGQTDPDMAWGVGNYGGAALGEDGDTSRGFYVDDIEVRAVGSLVVADVLSVAGVDHGHPVEAVALTEHAAVAVADAVHSHPVDAVELVVGENLDVADASHAHPVESPALVEHAALAVADVAHAHTVDVVALVEAALLTIAEAVHAHPVEAVAILEHAVIAIADAIHAHAVEAPSLVQHAALQVAAALHGHPVDNVTLGVLGVLAVQDSTHTHPVEALALIEAALLTIADAVHAHSAENVALVEQALLQIADVLHGHTADNVALILEVIEFLIATGDVLGSTGRANVLGRGDARIDVLGGSGKVNILGRD